MINIFTPPSTDQSVFYLSQIFGNVGNLMGTGTASSMILGTMFKTFNTVVLAVGTLIIIYVTIVGVMKTASEGEFLGKQWNSIWIPIRMVIGIAALVPTTSGYSSIQIFIMWIILQGIGAADTVWDKVLGYTDALGSPLSTITIPSVGVSNSMQTLFQGLVCQEGARANSKITSQSSTSGGYFCYVNATSNGFWKLADDGTQLWNITDTSPGAQTTISGNQYIYKMGPNGACGTMTFCANDPSCNDTSQVANLIKCNACKAQAGALQQVVTVMAPIAKAFIQGDIDFRTFTQDSTKITPWIQNYCSAIGATDAKTQCCFAPQQNAQPQFMQMQAQQGQTTNQCKIPNNLGDGSYTDANPEVVTSLILPYVVQPITQNIDFIAASVNNYVNALSNSAMGAVQQAVENKTTFSSSQLTQAHQVGWIFAGAYYYYLAQMNNNNVDAALPSLSLTPVTISSDPDNALNKFRNNYQVASNLMTQVATQTAQAGGNSSFTISVDPKISGLSKLSDGLQSSGSSVMDGFYNMITGAKAGQLATNPLTQLQTLGKILLIIAQVLFALIMIVLPMLTLLGYFDAFVLGTGVDNPVGGTITTLAIVFAPLFAVFLGSLFTFGALLAVYTPLIPYIVYTMGAITWFILVIEAMVAAPLVAIGILSPSGQHEVLGKAEHALYYVFGIFLRPTLMIFGLIAAMLLSVVVVTMINAAFSEVMGSIYTNPGLVEILLFLGAYVGLIVAALNKCFALIHIVPDRVLRWIGGQPEESGSTASEGLGGAKGGVQAAGAGAAGIGAGMQKKMTTAADKTRKAQAKQKEGEQQLEIKETPKDEKK